MGKSARFARKANFIGCLAFGVGKNSKAVLVSMVSKL